MFKKQILACVLSIFGLLYIGSSAAATLSFNPASTTVGLGDSFDVDVVISDLPFDDFLQRQALVGAFDVYVNYDPSIISSTGVSYSDALGIPGIDTITGPEFSVPGQANAVNTSFLGIIDPFELAAFQTSPSFTLATLSFQALAIGTSSLDFDPLFTLISDDFGLPIDALLVSGNVNVVPLPGAVWLMLTALLGIGAMARKNRAAAEAA